MNLQIRLKFARSLLLFGIVFNAGASAFFVYQGGTMFYCLALFMAGLSFVNGFVLAKLSKP